MERNNTDAVADDNSENKSDVNASVQVASSQDVVPASTRSASQVDLVQNEKSTDENDSKSETDEKVKSENVVDSQKGVTDNSGQELNVSKGDETNDVAPQGKAGDTETAQTETVPGVNTSDSVKSSDIPGDTPIEGSQADGDVNKIDDSVPKMSSGDSVNTVSDSKPGKGISKAKHDRVLAALLRRARETDDDIKLSKDEETAAGTKDTDPLLVKSDSQKTLQSDPPSSVKSESSSDIKKTENKKKHSYIPIVGSGKEKNSSDSKKKSNFNKPEVKNNSRVPVKASRTSLMGSSQNIALKDKNETVAPIEAKGETTFSVVNENEKNKPTKNVKWNENDKDKKSSPVVKKESRIPELDKKKQNLIQKTLQREKAVLSNGSVKPAEKENIEKTKTADPVIEETKIPLENGEVVEANGDGPFKPKSILARALLKKVKDGTEQGQNNADAKHVVMNGPPSAAKTPSKKSLTVPSPVPRDTSDEKDDLLSIGSRRDSTKLSLSDSMSRKSVDYRVANATTVVIPSSGQQEEKPKSVVNNDSWIRSAIPYLPLSMAILCLFLNIILPGFGTMLSGLAILCCGKARVQTKDDHVPITLCVNVWVGVAQLFTVTFLLVGWFWSMAWGIKMVILSIEYRKDLKQKREKELQALALSAFGSPSHGARSLFG